MRKYNLEIFKENGEYVGILHFNDTLTISSQGRTLEECIKLLMEVVEHEKL